MDLNIASEQEAAVTMLFSAVMYPHKNLNQSQIDQLSRMIVLSSKFRGNDLNELTKKALTSASAHESHQTMQECAMYISDDFRETLFAMICEIVTNEGSVDDHKTEILGLAALCLDMSVERMKMMLTTYLIRNKWNVRVTD